MHSFSSQPICTLSSTTSPTNNNQSSLSLSLSELTRPNARSSHHASISLTSSHLPTLVSYPSSTSLRFPVQPFPFQSSSSYLTKIIPYASLVTMYASHWPSCQHLLNAFVRIIPYKYLSSSLMMVSMHPFLSKQGRDDVVIQFAQAVIQYPSRIPNELRLTFRNVCGKEKRYNVALLLSFGAFYSTIISLLGLYRMEREQVLRKEKKKNRLHGFVKDFRGKFAKRKDILSDKKQIQEQVLKDIMGFSPEYLHNIPNGLHRMTFVYMLKNVILTDMCEQVSARTKCLGGYIISRYYENAILTAHWAYLANRFGADDRRLSTCLNMDTLHSMYFAETIGNNHNANSISSLVSSESSSQTDEQFPIEQNGYEQTTDKTILEENEFPEYSAVGGNITEDESDEEPESWNEQCPVPHEIEVDEVRQITTKKLIQNEFVYSKKEEYDVFSEEKMNYSPPMNDIMYDDIAQGVKYIGEQIQDVPKMDTNKKKKPDQNVSKLDENPAVPEVDGLNAINGDRNENEDHNMNESFDFTLREDVDSKTNFKHEEDESCIQLFSQSEMAFLLLCHETARSCRRYKYMESDCSQVTMQPALPEEFVVTIHNLFKPQHIMEMITVVACFNFLHRWTVCNPYRQGSLETPVRKFVQSPMAHNLSVDTVGQRVPSKYSSSSNTSRRKKSTQIS